MSKCHIVGNHTSRFNYTLASFYGAGCRMKEATYVGHDGVSLNMFVESVLSATFTVKPALSGHSKIDKTKA